MTKLELTPIFTGDIETFYAHNDTALIHTTNKTKKILLQKRPQALRNNSHTINPTSCYNEFE